MSNDMGIFVGSLLSIIMCQRRHFRALRAFLGLCKLGPCDMNMIMATQKNNQLHGITLQMQIEELVAEYGWEKLGGKIRINCFYENPSVNSSLKFLRKAPWARAKVEGLYLWTFFKRDGTRK